MFSTSTQSSQKPGFLNRNLQLSCFSFDILLAVTTFTETLSFFFSNKMRKNEIK